MAEQPKYVPVGEKPTAARRGNGRGPALLLLSAVVATAMVCAGLFAGWLIGFAVMGLFDRYLLVGMYYFAWPIVYPLVSAPVVFVLFLVAIRLFPGPYVRTLAKPRFLGFVLAPTLAIALLTMFATCPLDIGGNLLSRGAEAFGRES